MHFRVGVNLGDVVVKNEDLLGDGVNVAARLETMAEPGGICISSSVYDQITGKLDLGFQDIGEQTLKNISRPIRVYRVSGAGAPARADGAGRRNRRRARPRSMPWAAIGVVAVAAIGAAVAWQGGWLRFGSSEARESDGDGRAAVPLPPRRRALRRRRRSDAARAQAEADAQAFARRSRGHEAAGGRGAGACAGRSGIEPRGEGEGGRRRGSGAPARASRSRRGPDSRRRRSGGRAHQERCGSGGARPAPRRRPPRRAQAATVAAGPAVADKGARAPPGDASRFDGRWNVLIDCPRHTDGTAAFTIEFVAQVKDGFLKGERGHRGHPELVPAPGSHRARWQREARCEGPHG